MIAGFLREFSFAVAAFARALKQPCVPVLLVFFLSELLVDEVDAFADLVEGTLLLLPIALAYRGNARLPSFLPCRANPSASPRSFQVQSYPEHLPYFVQFGFGLHSSKQLSHLVFLTFASAACRPQYRSNSAVSFPD